ncbi:FeoC-like transcriptional regulator [Vibrio mangrovi]|uniref:FeoC-like transcriptional regulator n=1 Tax=Vibrio mangrovi TaxID=474394 RepID=A0A1Y6IS62_9VIBR|nr:FeoC-like transcriptional regulator [Vibrio mangrovi]MDW6001469.1 FeoC-like transcriptional regulator [Vibrio mangrovi]SMS00509.1 FeoC like transcriptional regulator [Vibrio mangrovi]
MILNELKSYLEQHGTTSGVELARRFRMSEDGVDAMLGVWVKKGIISRFVDTRPGGEVRRIRYAVNHPQTLSLTAIL